MSDLQSVVEGASRSHCIAKGEGHFGWRHLAALFIVALLIRLSAVFVFSSTPLGDNALQVFLPSARRIVAGLGFNDISTRDYVMAAPGYSYFLAAFLSVFGENLFPVRVSQAVIDSGTAVLTLFLANHVAGRRVAMIAFAGYAIYPLGVHYALSINPECVFTFMQGVSVFAFVQALRTSQPIWCVLAGVAFSVTSLTRSSSVVLPVLFAPFVLVAQHWTLRTWGQTALIIILTVSGPLLWGLRNKHVIDDFAPLQTGSGSTFLNGSDERWMMTIKGRESRAEFLDSLVPQGIAKPASGRETEINSWFWKAGIERYKMRWREDPIGFLKFLGWKFLRNWYATEAGHSGLMLGLIHFPLLAFFLCGIAVRWRGCDACDAVFMTVIALHVLMGTVFHPMVRYIVPAMPFIIVYASIGFLFALETLFPRCKGNCRVGPAHQNHQ